jgi:hypothetical protein
VSRLGSNWEEEVQRDFPSLRATVNSGARFDDADVRNARVLAECKDESGEAIRFPYSDYLKIVRQARLHRTPYWARFFRNGNGDKVVSINYDFAKLLFTIIFGKITCPDCQAEIKIDI